MRTLKNQKSRQFSHRPGSRYPVALRMAAVRDYLSGMSLREVTRKYSIADKSNVSRWKRIFANVEEFKTSHQMVKHRNSRILQTESESALCVRIQELERSLSICLKSLASKEKELKDTQLHLQISETMIDLAEETFEIAIRKNFGSK